MKNSCVLIPKVKDEDGKLQESNLFKDILKFTHNRE